MEERREVLNNKWGCYLNVRLSGFDAVEFDVADVAVERVFLSLLRRRSREFKHFSLFKKYFVSWELSNKKVESYIKSLLFHFLKLYLKNLMDDLSCAK